MFKLSKYNYYVTNSKDELLLYNAMAGKKSFLKVRKQNKQQVEKVLKGIGEIEKLPDMLLSNLKEGGFVIPEAEDEKIKMRDLYLKCIAEESLHLTVLPTEQCNFRCRYCYETFSDIFMKKDIQNILLSFISKNISKYKDLHIAWFGGEPLIALDTILTMSEDIQQICHRHKKSYTASTTTNGYLLDTETFRKLLKANVLYYQITIDGLEESHNAQRPLRDGRGSFDRIIKNLENIRDEIKSRMFRITIRTNFSRNMLNLIPEYKLFFGERFGNDPRFQFFFRPVMDWGGERIEDFKEAIFEEELMGQIYSTVMASKPKLNFIYDDFLQPGGSVCEAAKRNHYTVMPNGDIYKCTDDFSKCTEGKIGYLSPQDGVKLDSYQCARWLCNMENCDMENCFFAPVCLRECCPAQRVLHRKAKTKCPLEKRNLNMTLQLLDAENNIFREI